MKTQEAFRPRRILFVACLTRGREGGGALCPGPGRGVVGDRRTRKHTNVTKSQPKHVLFIFRLLQFMIEENVSLELKVESAVVLGSIAKGTEDNIRSLIDAGAISVLFKG